jgi:hypothetical protein
MEMTRRQFALSLAAASYLGPSLFEPLTPLGVPRGVAPGRVTWAHDPAAEIASTYDPADPLAWRQWHQWNLASQLFKVRLNKGKNVFTVHILTRGNMNLAYFDFKQAHG